MIFRAGFTLGGGVRYTDEVFVNAANTIRVPGYALVDAMVEYDVNTHLSLRLNVNNITDNVYIKNVNNNGGRFNPARREPRRHVQRPLLARTRMLLAIPDLLSAEQMTSARELLDRAEWVDGKGDGRSSVGARQEQPAAARKDLPPPRLSAT